MAVQPFLGKLEEVPLPHVIRQLYLEKSSGILDLHRDKDQRRIFIIDGEVRSARSNRMEQKIGQYAIRIGAITQPQLMHALSSKPDGTPVGKHLVELGFIEQGVLDEHLKGLVREILFDCFGWPNGEFKFFKGKPQLPPEVEIHVSTANIIYHGFKMSATAAMAVKMLGDPAGVLIPNPNLRLLFQHITLDPAGGYVLTRVNGTLSCEQVLSQLPGDRSENVILLGALLACGLITLKGKNDVAPPTDFFPQLVQLRGQPVPPAAPQPAGADAAAPGRPVRPGGPPPGRPPGARPGPPGARRRRPTKKIRLGTHTDFPRPQDMKLSKDDIALMRRNISKKYQNLGSFNHYQMFDLPFRATQKEVHFAFMNMAAFFHPDLALRDEFKDLKAQLEAVFGALEVAYRTLVDHEKRLKYNRKLGYL